MSEGMEPTLAERDQQVVAALEEQNQGPAPVTPVWEVVEDIARRLAPLVAAAPQGREARAVAYILEAVKILKGD